MNLRKLISVCMLINCSCAVFAQDIGKEVLHMISKTDAQKVARADLYINQGNEILFANFSYAADSLFQRQPNYIELSKSLLTGKRVSRLLFETEDFYKVGFETKIDVLKEYINQYVSKADGSFFEEVLSLNDSIEQYTAAAESIRQKNRLTAGLRKGGQQIHLSNLKYQQALVLCEEAFKVMARDKAARKKVQESTPMVVLEVYKVDDDSLLNIQAADQGAEDLTQEPVKSMAIVPVEKSLERENNSSGLVVAHVDKDDVYYTVQILADKKMVPQATIKKVYTGTYPIVKNQGDGWYRYSFGKFNTLLDAKKALEASKIKGYIVAYKNEKRIPLSEAKAWFAAQNK